MELGFQNGAVDDIFFVTGYEIHGSVVAQVCVLECSIVLFYTSVCMSICPIIQKSKKGTVYALLCSKSSPLV